jgi:hypothetical protein
VVKSHRLRHLSAEFTLDFFEKVCYTRNRVLFSQNNTFLFLKIKTKTMEDEIKQEEPVVEAAPVEKYQQIFNVDFLTITTAVVVVFTFTVINVLAYVA